MNKTDVILKVVDKTGMKEDVCEAILSEFEKQSEIALENKFKGTKTSKEDMNLNISKVTGHSLEDCEKVLSALNEVMGTGLSNKLKFIKNK